MGSCRNATKDGTDNAGPPGLSGLSVPGLIYHPKPKHVQKSDALLGRMSPRPSELECAYNRRPFSSAETIKTRSQRTWKIKVDMGYTLLSIFFAVGLFGAMMLMLEAGRWIAVGQMAVDPEGAKAGLGAVVGVVFSLLGLLLAFTFSGAASRFDARKQLIVQEVNTLGQSVLCP